MDIVDSVNFMSYFGCMSVEIFENAHEHGFLTSPINDAAEIAMMMSELGEAVQALRNGNPESKNITGFSCTEEELGDCVMRIMSYAEGKGWDVAGAIVAKHEFNKGRPYKHGKEF